MVLYGASSGAVPPLDPQVLNAKGSIFLTRPFLGHYTADRAELQWRVNDLFKWVAAGELKVRIDKPFPRGRRRGAPLSGRPAIQGKDIADSIAKSKRNRRKLKPSVYSGGFNDSTDRSIFSYHKEHEGALRSSQSFFPLCSLVPLVVKFSQKSVTIARIWRYLWIYNSKINAPSSPVPRADSGLPPL